MDYCQSCGFRAPTKYVEFYQIIGLLFGFRTKSIRGNFCKDCINKYCWPYTGITLLLGWWGVLSFLITPFVLLNNLLRYIGTLGLEAPTIAYPTVAAENKQMATTRTPSESQSKSGRPSEMPPRNRHEQGTESKTELERIWNKWANVEVPSQAESACSEVAQAIAEHLMDLTGLIARRRTLDEKTSHKLGEQAGHVVARMARASFMVGLEYGSTGKLRTQEASGIDFPDVVRRLLTTAAKPVAELAYLLVEGCKANGVINEEGVRTFRENSTNLITAGAAQCYSTGLDFSAKVKTSADYESKSTQSNSALGMVAEVAFSDSDANVRAEAQRAVKELFPGGVEGFENTVSIFVSGLRDPDEQRRNLATLALVGFGEMSVPFLQPLLKDDNPDIRRLAIQILTAIEKEQRGILKGKPS